MNKRKLQSVKKLMKAKQYILITENYTVVDADFTGFEGMMMVHSIKGLIKSLEKALTDLTKKVEKSNGRNVTGRSKRSPDK